jgi:hypothetical protein
VASRVIAIGGVLILRIYRHGGVHTKWTSGVWVYVFMTPGFGMCVCWCRVGHYCLRGCVVYVCVCGERYVRSISL